MRVQSHVVFFMFFYPRAKPPTFTPAAARSEQLLLLVVRGDHEQQRGEARESLQDGRHLFARLEDSAPAHP